MPSSVCECVHARATGARNDRTRRLATAYDRYSARGFRSGAISRLDNRCFAPREPRFFVSTEVATSFTYFRPCARAIMQITTLGSVATRRRVDGRGQTLDIDVSAGLFIVFVHDAAKIDG